MQYIADHDIPFGAIVYMTPDRTVRIFNNPDASMVWCGMARRSIQEGETITVGGKDPDIQTRGNFRAK